MHLNKMKGSKMKRVLTLLLAICMCCLVACEFQIEEKSFSEDTDAIEEAVKSVVKIFCFDYDGNEVCTGSGFVLLKDDVIITNYHVIEDAYTCKILTEDEISYTVSNVLAYSVEKDIAILQLNKPTELTVFETGDSSTISRGANVTAIGSPLGLKNTVSQGILSGRIIGNGFDILQFTAPISEGSSGGALFDDGGKVIGVTYASYIEGQNLNLAIPIELVTELYENEYDSITLTSLYENTHQYIKYLSKYSDAIGVTLEELRNNPTKYNQKVIILKAYVSSVSLINGIGLYCTESIDRISNNYEYDNQEAFSFIDNNVPLQSRKTISASCYSWEYDKNNIYIVPSISAGDEVVIVGGYEYKTELLNRPFLTDYISIFVAYK